MNHTSITPADIVAFWLDAGPDRWFKKDVAFDVEIRKRYLSVWQSARRDGLSSWAATDDGALALILVLDQFPRNMLRDSAEAFATDGLARDAAVRAIADGLPERIDPDLRQFVYMPLMHSEDLADQQRCVALFRDLGNSENLRFANLHEDIIRRFGRFPHRNRVLGRTTTAQEQAFLNDGGFSG